MRRAAPLCGILFLVAGCPGNDLRGRTHGIRDVIRQARANGAYKCAPRELAMAESHVDFAENESPPAPPPPPPAQGTRK